MLYPWGNDKYPWGNLLYPWGNDVPYYVSKAYATELDATREGYDRYWHNKQTVSDWVDRRT